MTLTKRKSHTRYRGLPSVVPGPQSEPIYAESVAVRVCRLHGLDCTEDGDRVICPAGHELEWPRVHRGNGREMDIPDEAEVPWRVELRRSARLRG